MVKILEVVVAICVVVVIIDGAGSMMAGRDGYETIDIDAIDTRRNAIEMSEEREAWVLEEHEEMKEEMEDVEALLFACIRESREEKRALNYIPSGRRRATREESVVWMSAEPEETKEEKDLDALLFEHVRAIGKKKRTLNPLPIGRPIRVYVDGIFDLFHYGHVRLLQQVKNIFGPDHEVHVVVGVCSDEVAHRLKRKTVMYEFERYESVRQCRHVTEVIEDIPWVPTMYFLREHRIDYVAHDDAPYSDAYGNDVYASVKSAGMFVTTHRADGISTSDLITRVLANSDEFIRRNLARGIPREDMNVSFAREQLIILEECLADEMDVDVADLGNEVANNVAEIRKEMAGAAGEISTSLTSWALNSKLAIHSTKIGDRLLRFMQARSVSEQ